MVYSKLYYATCAYQVSRFESRDHYIVCALAIGLAFYYVLHTQLSMNYTLHAHYTIHIPHISVYHRLQSQLSNFFFFSVFLLSASLLYNTWVELNDFSCITLDPRPYTRKEENFLSKTCFHRKKNFGLPSRSWSWSWSRKWRKGTGNNFKYPRSTLNAQFSMLISLEILGI